MLCPYHFVEYGVSDERCATKENLMVEHCLKVVQTRMEAGVTKMKQKKGSGNKKLWGSCLSRGEETGLVFELINQLCDFFCRLVHIVHRISRLGCQGAAMFSRFDNSMNIAINLVCRRGLLFCGH